MAKDEKRISINAFEKIAKEQFPEYVTEHWFDIEVTIRRSISLTEMIEFVQEIVNACILEDGSYHPEIMDFAIKSGILTHYANFTLPTNLEKQYWLIYSTGAVDMVYQHINTVQLQEIVNSANRKIDYLCDYDVAAVKAKLDKILENFATMGDQMEAIFSGVDNEDLQKVVAAVGDGKLSEEKIVSAYIDQTKKPAEGSVNQSA